MSASPPLALAARVRFAYVWNEHLCLREPHRRSICGPCALSGMVRLSADGRRAIVRVKGLPAIELRLKRELPPAEQLRSLRIVFRGEKLYVGLVFAEEVAPLAPTGRSAGIDLGVNSRVALSDGTLVDGRTPDRRRERRLRRALSRCRRGSRGRVKRSAQLARETQRNKVRNHGAGAALRPQRHRGAADRQHDALGEGHDRGARAQREREAGAQSPHPGPDLGTADHPTHLQGRVGR